MKKTSWVLSMLLIFCFGFMLAGCGPKQNQATYSTLTKEEAKETFANLNFSISHWSVVQYDSTEENATRSMIIAKDSIGGANYIYSEEPKGDYKVQRVCIDGDEYTYVDQTAVFIGDAKYHYNDVIADSMNVIGFLDLEDLDTAYEYIDTKKYTSDAFVEYHVTINYTSGETYNKIKLIVKFNTNNQCQSLGQTLYLNDQSVSEMSMSNYTESYNNPSWFNIYDFDNVTTSEGVQNLSYAKVLDKFKNLNFSTQNWTGVTTGDYSSSEKTEKIMQFVKPNDSGENYCISGRMNGAYYNEYCVDGVSYIYNNNTPSKVASASQSYDENLSKINERVAKMSNLKTVAASMPFISASLNVDVQGYVYTIMVNAKSANADTRIMYFAFDIKGNFRGCQDDIISKNKITNSYYVERCSDPITTPSWFNNDDFNNL